MIKHANELRLWDTIAYVHGMPATEFFSVAALPQDVFVVVTRLECVDYPLTGQRVLVTVRAHVPAAAGGCDMASRADTREFSVRDLFELRKAFGSQSLQGRPANAVKESLTGYTADINPGIAEVPIDDFFTLLAGK